MTRLVPAVFALVSLLALLGTIAAPMLRAATLPTPLLPAPSVNPWAPTRASAVTAAQAAETLPRRAADEGSASLVPTRTLDEPGPVAEAPVAEAPAAVAAPTPTSAPAAAGGGSRAAAPAAPAPPRGPSLVIPELGIRNAVTAMPCDHVRPVNNETYRWECAGSNNLYLLGHAHSVFKGLHDSYEAGRLHAGLLATYTDASGRATTYAVTEWRVVTQDQVGWAVAAQPVASMTLQTCVGANSEHRLLVRLVAVS